ncbi:aminodeoxychorismate synthase component 1 [mine drainage metagenome]|uniref:aminodeoxychorismate synthase n=1 Tax=mine drainage metagenome TaxID=410659 RepID=A0A1J5PWD3_9ZZZZ
MPALISELPYREDSAALFAQIAHAPWAVFLDSGSGAGEDARYDIMACDPFITLTTQDDQTEICDSSGTSTSAVDAFTLLKSILHRYACPAVDGLPFSGGALGYFSYDLARMLERLPARAMDAEHLPQMSIGIYDWALVVDHAARRTHLVGQGHDDRTPARWAQLCAMFSAIAESESGIFRVTSPVVSNLDLPAYSDAFRRVQGYIQAGDCYQVNLAQRFCARAEGDPWTAFRQLRRISPAPFSAYLNTPAAQVLSVSPERFLRVMNGQVETRPIKGTRPRGDDPGQDLAYAEALRSSPKDRAENLMIVDLLRNDIGKNCAVGSVRATRLFELESFANVHHLVSTVTGRLAPGRDAIDLLRGCFPGGSITGAPKLRAMQIIEELEPHRRGVYCGAIGYIGFDGNMDTSIAIRTAVFSAGKIRFWAGGGIVADSEMQKEYHETWDKASSLLQLMEHFHVGG